MYSGALRDRMMGAPRSVRSTSMIYGPHAVAGAQVFFRDHLAAAQAAFDLPALDDDVALVHALDGAHEDLVAARHEVVQQHFALGVADLLQDHLLGGHGADAADRHGVDGLLDEVAFFDVGDVVAHVGDEFLGVRILQAGGIGHHQPAAEGFVIAAVAVHRDADVHLALVELLGGLRQGRLDGAENDVTLHVFLTGDGIDQHQHFAIHVTNLLNTQIKKSIRKAMCEHGADTNISSPQHHRPGRCSRLDP
jgi:hypothetical protein